MRPPARVDYDRQHTLEIKVARIFNTYAPWMHPADGHVVSNFIVRVLKNERITIYGEGQQTRSFCYVDDPIGAFVAFMATPPEWASKPKGTPRKLLGSSSPCVRAMIVRVASSAQCPHQRRAGEAAVAGDVDAAVRLHGAGRDAG